MRDHGPDDGAWFPFNEPQPASLRPGMVPWRHGIEVHAGDAALDLRYPEPDEWETAG